MTRDRIYSLSEARSDYHRPARRREPLTPAAVRPGDPEYLHRSGMSMRLRVAGQQVDLFTIKVMAEAVSRSPETVRRWIRLGIMPEAPYRAPGRTVAGQKRLWPRADILAAARAVESLELQTHPAP